MPVVEPGRATPGDGGLGQSGQATGRGPARDGLARKLGRGCMADNRKLSEIAQGRVIDRLGPR
jgi:hypothetical protein